jgi:hypothetical protein
MRSTAPAALINGFLMARYVCREISYCLRTHIDDVSDVRVRFRIGQAGYGRTRDAGGVSFSAATRGRHV